MSSETIEVMRREGVGSRASQKLRQSGHVPAILYGHGEENVNLSVRADVIHRIVDHGTKLLSLTGALSDTALLREVQWDAFGAEILHVDFNRVSQTESVEVTLPVHLHGEAPGSNEGGMLAFSLHELTIQCPAANIPEHIEVNISNLHVGDAIHVSDISLPEGASLVTPAADVVVQVNRPSGAQAESSLEAEEGAAEPELIGKGGEGEEEAAE
jgi:large subunit ribosomal protein L25